MVHWRSAMSLRGKTSFNSFQYLTGCGNTPLEELAQGAPHAHLQFPEIATMFAWPKG